MQAQTTRRLRAYRFNRGILIALAGVGLLVASLVGIRALTDGPSVSQTPALSPVAAPVEKAPARPDDWLERIEPHGAAASRATVAGPDITTLNLDQHGADVFTTGEVSGSSTTRLDRAAAIEGGMGFTEERSAGDVTPRSTSELLFFEDNTWDYTPRAQPTGYAEAPMSAADYRFIEENNYGIPPMRSPTGELGQLDY